MTILEGAVVFVDDQYDEVNTYANAFYEELKSAGRPVAVFSDLPHERFLEHWEGVALAVIDWNLRAPEDRVPGASALRADDRRRMVDFLVLLLDRFFCPVFIVSTDPPAMIEDALTAAQGFPPEVLAPGCESSRRSKSQKASCQDLKMKSDHTPCSRSCEPGNSNISEQRTGCSSSWAEYPPTGPRMLSMGRWKTRSTLGTSSWRRSTRT